MDRVPRKSLAATMFAEMETLSKIPVQKELLKGQKNVLHADSTMYNFEEVGGFKISTGSGSFTLGIGPMYSGEADSYFEMFKHMLEDLYSLAVPEEQVDQDAQKVLISFKALMTDHTIMNSAFLKTFSHWREECLLFVVQNYNILPDDEQEMISNIHHVFCRLHVLHNLGKKKKKSLIDWEKIVEEERTIHGSFKNSSNSRTFDLLYGISKLLSRSHEDQKSGKADQWPAYLKKNNLENYIVSLFHH